jgi:hypothetical protein
VKDIVIEIMEIALKNKETILKKLEQSQMGDANL